LPERALHADLIHKQAGAARHTLDPDAPDSAMAKIKREILETVKEQARDLRNQLQEMAVVVAASRRRRADRRQGIPL
jgi:hypothetical protein